VRALEEARQLSPAIGDAWILPSPSDHAEPCSRNIARDWWLRVERAAELEHVKGLGWHGLRRKFGEEMKDVPLKGPLRAWRMVRSADGNAVLSAAR